jgi:hypothetical protein
LGWVRVLVVELGVEMVVDRVRLCDDRDLERRRGGCL